MQQFVNIDMEYGIGGAAIGAQQAVAEYRGLRGQRVELVEPTGRRRNRAPVREMVRMRLSSGRPGRGIDRRRGALNDDPG